MKRIATITTLCWFFAIVSIESKTYLYNYDNFKEIFTQDDFVLQKYKDIDTKFKTKYVGPNIGGVFQLKSHGWDMGASMTFDGYKANITTSYYCPGNGATITLMLTSCGWKEVSLCTIDDTEWTYNRTIPYTDCSQDTENFEMQVFSNAVDGAILGFDEIKVETTEKSGPTTSPPLTTTTKTTAAKTTAAKTTAAKTTPAKTTTAKTTAAKTTAAKTTAAKTTTAKATTRITTSKVTTIKTTTKSRPSTTKLSTTPKSRSTTPKISTTPKPKSTTTKQSTTPKSKTSSNAPSTTSKEITSTTTAGTSTPNPTTNDKSTTTTTTTTTAGAPTTSGSFHPYSSHGFNSQLTMLLSTCVPLSFIFIALCIFKLRRGRSSDLLLDEQGEPPHHGTSQKLGQKRYQIEYNPYTIEPTSAVKQTYELPKTKTAQEKTTAAPIILDDHAKIQNDKIIKELQKRNTEKSIAVPNILNDHSIIENNKIIKEAAHKTDAVSDPEVFVPRTDIQHVPQIFRRHSLNTFNNLVNTDFVLPRLSKILAKKQF